ncbi:MAG: glycosyltransferase family 2 protein [Candidatus Bathyarchaeota archaeon]
MSKDFTHSNITVVIPTLNEEKGIGSTILELRNVLKDAQYLVVDGKSTDSTVKIAKLLNADVITQEGSGKGAAIAQALKSINSDTQYLVFIDADFTYPTDNILKMIEILDNNLNVGMVTGNRFSINLEKKTMGNIFYYGNRIIAFIHSLFNGISLKDPLTGLRVLRWDALKDWEPKSKGFDIEVELNYYLYNNYHHVIEIPISYRKRLGTKKLSFKHGLTILKRILVQGLI